MDSKIEQDKLQRLSDLIANSCEELELDPMQTLDGIASTLIAAAKAFGVDDFKFEIDGSGKIELFIE